MVSTMGKKLAKDDDGLTRPEAAAAKAYASGLGQADAYRAGFHGQSKPSTIHSKASVLFARPDIRARIRDLLRAAKISDITSVGGRPWAHGDMIPEPCRIPVHPTNPCTRVH